MLVKAEEIDGRRLSDLRAAGEADLPFPWTINDLPLDSRPIQLESPSGKSLTKVQLQRGSQTIDPDGYLCISSLADVLVCIGLRLACWLVPKTRTLGTSRRTCPGNDRVIGLLYLTLEG